MDVPRGKEVARKRLIKRIVLIVLAALVIGGTTVAVARLKPAAPSVDMSGLWPGTVKRGPLEPFSFEAIYRRARHMELDSVDAQEGIPGADLQSGLLNKDILDNSASLKLGPLPLEPDLRADVAAELSAFPFAAWRSDARADSSVLARFWRRACHDGSAVTGLDGGRPDRPDAHVDAVSGQNPTFAPNHQLHSLPCVRHRLGYKAVRASLAPPRRLLALLS